MTWPITVPKGKPVRGHRAKDYCTHLLKVAVAWEPLQVEAINRRVVRNNSTFAKEARRLMRMALDMDHQ